MAILIFQITQISNVKVIGCCPLRKTPFSNLVACARTVLFPDQRIQSSVWEWD